MIYQKNKWKILSKAVLGLGFLSILESAAMVGASWAPLGVSEEHRPNIHTLSCLDQLTKECAFSAALETVIAEELSLERAKILIGIGQALLQQGDKEQALSTLTIALEEARNANISLVLQDKLRRIAPLIAETGDLDKAFQLASEITVATLKRETFEKIGEQAARAGHWLEAQKALNLMGDERQAFWRALDFLLFLPQPALMQVDLASYLTRIEELPRFDERYRGFFTLSLVYENLEAAQKSALPAQQKQDGLLAPALARRADAILNDNPSAVASARLLSLQLRALDLAGRDSAALKICYDQLAPFLRRLDMREKLELITRVAPIQSALGELDTALAALDIINGLPEKARYLASLRPDASSAASSAALGDLLRAYLGQLEPFESAYERDAIRFDLLEAAIVAKDIDLAKMIVRALEDDDNQALGLVALIRLL